MEQQKNNNLPKKLPNSYVKYSGMGIKMATIMIGGTFAGIELDKWLQLKFPVFTLIFSMLSVFLAIYYFIKDFIKK
ncbi:MAG: AtpZ/AtpI family protein [Bacteroidetes bacterium]|nr:AtpZ/AtpI family protein [Bacteroidota bacterium]